MINSLNTLRYWFDVEALTAPDAEEADDKGPEHFVTYLRTRTMPWDKQNLNTKVCYTHFVRFGIINKSSYENELLSELKTKLAENHDPAIKKRESGFTYLGVVEIDPDGDPQPNTIELAAFASSFASLKHGRNIDFNVLSTKMMEFYNDLCEQYREPNRKADVELFSSLICHILKLLNWEPSGFSKDNPELIIVSKMAMDSLGKVKNPKIDPVNGFFLDDLRSVISDVQNSRPSGLVKEYLKIYRNEERTDCTNNDFIDAALSHNADHWPDGKWPSKNPLALMQQVAVNSAIAKLKDGGIFSINGPPGTGKTTLLMDIVASVVTERAKVLSTFKDPKDAFTLGWEINYSGMSHAAKVYRLDKRLHDFLIVVASANNGAVENVTREFPLEKQVDSKYRSQIDFFPQVATKLINSSSGDDDEENSSKTTLSAWGLISAVLGKNSNRNVFKDIMNNKDDPDVIEFLKHVKTPTSWSDAKFEFDEALKFVRNVKNSHANFEALEVSIEQYETEIENITDRKADLEKEMLMIARDVDISSTVCNEKADDLRNTDRNIDISKPSFITKILASFPVTSNVFDDARNKMNRFNALVAERMEHDQALKECRTELKRLKERLSKVAAENSETAKLLKSKSIYLSVMEDELEEFSGNRKNFMPYTQFSRLRPEDKNQEHLRQTSLPRSCDILDEARAMLFVKAIALHKAFIVNAGRPFSGNLQRALGMMTADSVVKEIAPEAGLDLWATLSLVVPVVSSTFSSFARCFEYMPRGSIGWLIVDEAGQAVPQHAVGALTRSKRALIVGDPLQVQPVITLDKNIDKELLKRHSAPLDHQSTMKSLQLLADANNPYGTYLSSSNGDDVWVGSPLRVHRRCLEPMFSISNAIAYNNTMVHGLGVGAADGDKSCIGRSMWFDTPGKEGANKHYFPKQGELALDIIRAFFDQGCIDESTKLPSLFIISPFKSVANEMKYLLSRNKHQFSGQHSPQAIEKWIKKSVGTVHTFQGKEAEVVVFVLGGNSDGAIRWAASEPNIINVGVTRSKKQLYVIGDWNEWMKTPLVRKTMNFEWREGYDRAKARIRHLHRVSGNHSEDGRLNRPIPNGFKIPISRRQAT